MLVGGATLPLLPVARAAEKHTVGEDGVKGPEGDPTRCEYWRHCAIDGFLCSCCGGSHKACPPGTEEDAAYHVRDEALRTPKRKQL